MSIRGYLEALRLVAAKPVAEFASTSSIPETSRPGLALSAPCLGDFEVNMVECLVGWKCWKLDRSSGLLTSPTYHLLWPVDEAVEALCGCSPDHANEWHSCGIYAIDQVEGCSHQYGPILGQVYGWGRYIRGDRGWRAQFAYPKSFHLSRHQADLIEALKQYHVPIFIDEPLQIYNPTEEGYSNGYGQTEAEGYSRAPEESHSDSEGSADTSAEG